MTSENIPNFIHINEVATGVSDGGSATRRLLGVGQLFLC